MYLIFFRGIRSGGYELINYYIINIIGGNQNDKIRTH